MSIEQPKSQSQPVRLRVPLELLRCPATGAPLAQSGQYLKATDSGRNYSVVDGVPILVAPDLSPVDVAGYVHMDGPDHDRRHRVRAVMRALVWRGPSISLNLASARNYSNLVQLLSSRRPDATARVLVVGGATAGVGFDALTSADHLEIVDVDLALGPRTSVVCDAHNLPFAAATFDAVITQAVLEHVMDPHRVVAEIHRVLVPDGIVYSEIPFMQQVHEGAHDVTRFTLVGHRHLYRCFDEVDSGVTGGPAVALLWAIRYFFLAFSASPPIRAVTSRLVSLSLFWLKYLDYYLAPRRGGADGASGTFFLGTRRDTAVPDRAILDGYRGAVPTASSSVRS